MRFEFHEADTKSGVYKLMGEMELKGGKVVIRGEDWFVDYYKKTKVFDPTDYHHEEPFGPEDGEDFLKAACRSAAIGSYFFARKVEAEGDAEAESG